MRKNSSMRVILVAIILLAAQNIIFGQNTSPWPSAGNVGIGTTIPEATGKLTVDAGYNDSEKQGIYIKASAGTHLAGPSLILDNYATWSPGRSFIRGISRTSTGPVYTDICLYNGNVGIGTNYPEPTGILTIDAGFSDTEKRGIYVKGTAGTNDSGPSIILDNKATWGSGRSFIRGISRASTGVVFTDICLSNGQVGIGTNYPISLLSVKGKITAQEVQVTLNGWADYVFDNSYKLRPLSQVESFIKENKHLPEIPSAKEVETNGINLGEMDALLLKKIEELTLYIIEMKKENQAIKQEIQQLKAK